MVRVDANAAYEAARAEAAGLLTDGDRVTAGVEGSR